MLHFQYSCTPGKICIQSLHENVQNGFETGHQSVYCLSMSLTCRGRFSVDRRCRRDESGEEEGSQRAFGVEGWALRGQILTAAHAAVDFKVQRLRLLLGSKKKKQDEKIEIINSCSNTWNWTHLSKSTFSTSSALFFLFFGKLSLLLPVTLLFSPPTHSANSTAQCNKCTFLEGN